jgi:hypothetical protein
MCRDTILDIDVLELCIWRSISELSELKETTTARPANSDGLAFL